MEKQDLQAGETGRQNFNSTTRSRVKNINENETKIPRYESRKIILDQEQTQDQTEKQQKSFSVASQL